ncbi:MAG: hypothetical protein WC501_03630 [Candidatus Micrarchaeia archaeon]
MKKKKILTPNSNSKTPKTSFRNRLYESINSVTSTLKIVGLILAVSLLLYPKDLHSQDKKAEPAKDKPATVQIDAKNAVAQAESRKGTFNFEKKKEIELDISKLPKVSLNEIQVLDFKTQTQHKDIRMPDYESFEGYYTTVSVDFFDRGDGKVHGLAAHLMNCKSPGCNPGPIDKVLVVAAEGKLIGNVDLTLLNDAYKQRTGKEMIYAKIVVDHHMDKEEGELVDLMVVPINKPNQEINGDALLLWVSYKVELGALSRRHILYIENQ